MGKLIRMVCLILGAGLLASSCASGETPVSRPEEDFSVPVINVMREFPAPDNEGLAMTRALAIGWNLGNTFDAFDGYTRHDLGIGMETRWGVPKTTKELFAALKAAGFSSVRIPVSWHNHVDEEDRIDADWMARVREVALWALEQDLYVIVNVHHDNDVRWFYPDEAHYDRSAAYLSAIWRQMAEAFADCGDHLILESMNEPRLVGTQDEWNWTGSEKQLEAAGCINRLNQLFVDTVRAGGGNNATRFLSVPAYTASPESALSDAFQLPQDSTEHRIIVAAHAYTPYNFALNTESPDRTFDLETDQAKKSEIAQFLNALYGRYVSVGIPVMMDEFGALEKSGNTQARVNFTAWYVASAAARWIPCFWWDNSNFTGGGERFGLIRRDTCEWVYPAIMQAMMDNRMK